MVERGLAGDATVTNMIQTRFGEFSADNSLVSYLYRLDRNGEPEFLRINLLCRSSFFNGSVDDWEQLYPALKELMKILQECSIVFKNKPGINKSSIS